jgi:hypothetical protein
MNQMIADRSATPAEPPASRAPSGRVGIGKRPETGPYSRALERGAVGALNGNSREAKFIKAYAAMLVEHCGGNPTAVQRQLITRAARLACHLELWDERTIPNGGAVTATGHNHYIAWHNAMTRTLAALGLKPSTADPPVEDAIVIGRRLDAERRERQQAAAD